MKTLAVICAAILFCLSGMAKDPGSSWVVTNSGKIDCKRVTLGYKKARLVLENGEKTTIDFNNISSLSMNGRTFAKLPLYENGKPTHTLAFMELLKTKGDLSVYKLGYHEINAADPNEIIFHYFLYKGNKQYLVLEGRSLANICQNFGISEDQL